MSLWLHFFGPPYMRVQNSPSTDRPSFAAVNEVVMQTRMTAIHCDVV